MLDKPIGRTIFVAVGSFNPAIFHPDWFDRHSILPAEETQTLMAPPTVKKLPEIGATLEYGKHFLVDPTQAVLNCKAMKFNVQRDKFQIECEKRDDFPFMLEVIKKIFMLLPETPINAYGFNFHEHLECEENIQQITTKLFIPTENVQNFCGENCAYGHSMNFNANSAKISIDIAASQLVNGGVYFKSNFHHENPGTTNRYIVETVVKNFEKALNLAEEFILKFFGNIVRRHDKLYVQEASLE